MNTQIGKWGNCLAVRIPGNMVKELDLEEGMELEITHIRGGILLRPRKHVYILDELLDKITPENIHGETDWGPAIGGEAW